MNSLYPMHNSLPYTLIHIPGVGGTGHVTQGQCTNMQARNRLVRVLFRRLVLWLLGEILTPLFWPIQVSDGKIWAVMHLTWETIPCISLLPMYWVSKYKGLQHKTQRLGTFPTLKFNVVCMLKCEDKLPKMQEGQINKGWRIQ